MMRFGTIPHVGKPISRIVQGCTMLSDGDGQSRSNDLLDEVFEAGVNAFDHAWQYGEGKCERAFGHWLNLRGVRENVVIIDKGCHPVGDQNRLSPGVIESEINESLERLGVECIDLWLFHRDDPSVPVGSLVEIMNRMVDDGKVRAFGGSNWTHARVREANEYAADRGLQGFAASSPHFSLAEQIASPWGEDCITISGCRNADARHWYAADRLGVLCWSSLAGGFLSGRYSLANRDDMVAELPDYTVRSYESDDNWHRLQRATELATEKNVGVAQIAISYVLHQPMNAFALVRASRPESIRSSVDALDVSLTAAELDWLDLRTNAR